MKKIKKVKKNKLSKSEKINMFLFSLICILTLSFTVGYSLLNQELSISGEAHFRPQEDLRITNIRVREAINGAVSSYENYSKKTVSAGCDLPYSDSTISYETTFTNFGTSEMMISNVIETINNYNVFYTLDEVVIDENGYETLVPINGVVGVVFKPGEQKKFVMTFKYHTYDDINTSLAGMLEFEFISNVKSKLAMGSSDLAGFFNGNIPKESIESIEIVPTMIMPEDGTVLGSWDASLDGDESVVAWYTNLDGDDLYELTLGCNKTLIAPEDSTMLFYGFTKMTTLNLNGILNTSLVKNMTYMFMGNSSLTSLKLDGLFTTPLVDDMYGMFANNSALSNLELTTVTTPSLINAGGLFNGVQV